MALPQSVLDLVELRPFEDLALAILSEGLPEIPVHTLIPAHPTFPFILSRRDHAFGGWGGDPRFVDEGRLLVQTFTQDPDGDSDGALLSEAARVVLRNAWLSHYSRPDLGSIITLKMATEPTQVTDWATSAGPVQYAELPQGIWRYETTYEIKVRKPLT